MITSLAVGKAPEGTITSVRLLGAPGFLEFTQDAEGLKVKLPPTPPNAYAVALKIEGLTLNQSGPAVPAEPPGNGR